MSHFPILQTLGTPSSFLFHFLHQEWRLGRISSGFGWKHHHLHLLHWDYSIVDEISLRRIVSSQAKERGLLSKNFIRGKYKHYLWIVLVIVAFNGVFINLGLYIFPLNVEWVVYGLMNGLEMSLMCGLNDEWGVRSKIDCRWLW